MGKPVREREILTKCSVKGCPGEYRASFIIHTVKRGEEVLVFVNVPAEECAVCSDTLLSPETVRHLEEMMRYRPKPEKFAPLHEYA